MAPHSSTLAWKIPWMEEPGGLQSMGSLSRRTRLKDFTFTFHFHALEKEMATHSSVLAWRIPGTGEPGGLLSVGSHRVGHDWSDLAAAAAEVKASACNAGDLDSIPGSGRSPGEGNGNPLHYSCLENPMGRGAWWAIVHGVTKSQTRLSDFTSLKHIKSIFLVMKAYHKYSLTMWFLLTAFIINEHPGCL